MRAFPSLSRRFTIEDQPVPLKESEAIVLRSYPLRESDLLVTFFTRAEGKVRGVARAAKKSKKRFGGALEPLTYVRVYYEDRERQELARIDSCEVLESPLADEVSYARAVALGHVAEVLDELLPDRESNDAIFRLALAVLSRLRTADIGLEPAPVACAAARPASSTGAIANCANFFMIAPLLGRRRRCLRPSLGEIVAAEELSAM